MRKIIGLSLLASGLLTLSTHQSRSPAQAVDEKHLEEMLSTNRPVPLDREALERQLVSDHFKAQYAQMETLLAAYFDPKISSMMKSVKIIPKINQMIFTEAYKLGYYDEIMNVVKNCAEMKSDSGIELLIFMQSVWEQRFGPDIRQNLRDPRWRREGMIWTGGILGYAGSFLYSRGKVGAIARLTTQLLPYVGLGTGYLGSKNYDAKRADNIPQSPFEILGFGNDRPEDHRWNNGDSLAWNMAEVMTGVTAFPVAKHLSNKFASRFTEKKNCLDAAELIVNHYAHKQNSLSFLKEVKGAGIASFKALRGVKNGEKADWKAALTISEQEVSNFKDYLADYVRNWGPVGLVGGVAGYLALQVSMNEYSHHLSNESLRTAINESQKKLEHYKAQGNVKELELEGYRFRGYIEYYSDIIMIDITERTEEQLYKAIVKSDGTEASAKELERINRAIRKTYSSLEWQVFASRIQAFVDATEEYPDSQMPGLYREVLTDGLPRDSGNVLLYGATILHKNGLKREFDRIRDKVAYVYSVYKTMSDGEGADNEKK